MEANSLTTKRELKYLSPTSIGLYESDKELFYLRYVCVDRPERDPQTHQMAVGSAFDAYVKGEISKILFGKDTFEELFATQVEDHNKQQARIDGLDVFNQYKASGALADLMLHLESAIGEPEFEFTAKGKVDSNVERSIGDVVFLGKPDAYFTNKEGHNVIHDWKVNGYYAKTPPSPMKGYVNIRPGGGAHRDAMVQMYKGMNINLDYVLEVSNKDWARQLAIYAWLCGEEIGADFLVSIDQLCGRKIRVAQHRCRISPKFQQSVFDLATEIWDVVKSDHFFREVSKQESQDKCEILNKRASVLRDPTFASII